MPAARTAALALLAGLIVGCSGTPAPPDKTAAEPRADAPAKEDSKLEEKEKEKPKEVEKPDPKTTPKPGKITLPADGGQWPWNLAAAPPPSEFVPVRVPGVTDWVTGIAVSPASRRAVLFQKVAAVKFGGVEKTRVVLLDTAAGKVLVEWEVRDLLVPLALSPDGKQILATPQVAQNALVLLTVGEKDTLKRRAWTPHGHPDPDDNFIVINANYEPDNPAMKVSWAGFVGNTRVVSAAAGGQLRVFDTATADRLGSIEAVPGKPTLTPDGTRVVFLTNAGATLLDAETCTVVGVRKIGAPAGDRCLAVNPGGKTVACAAPGRVRFLDLGTGDLWDVVLPRLGNGSTLPRTFGWAGNRHLLADDVLYDPDLPCPAWTYGRADARAFAGREVWVAVPPEAFSKSTTVTVRPYVLPHGGVTETILAGRSNPDLFILRPGDRIQVDVADVPGAQQKTVRADLEKRLKVVGYKPDPAGTATLFASVDKVAVPASATYIGGGTVPYNRRPARLKLLKQGQELWSQAWAVEPPFSLWLSRNDTLERYFDRNGVGSPDYDLFTRAPIPPVFPGTKFPSHGFGHHEFHPDGLREWGIRGKLQ